jgi:hypothetical protein
MKDKPLTCGGEACVQNPDGSYSAAALHEQMTQGVDDHDFRMQTRAKLLAAGVPIADLDRAWPYVGLGYRSDYGARIEQLNSCERRHFVVSPSI